MNKIKNNILIKNIFILLIFGGLSKILGMFGKIIFTRMAGIEIISIYSIVIPTFMLIITITQFSMPISISKITSEDKYNNKDLLFNSILINIIIDIILIIVILLSSNNIALMLHDKNLSGIIKSITLIIPFISITSIQRGFLHGNEDMFLSSITNIIEEVIKIALILIVLPLYISNNKYNVVIIIILFNIVMEVSSMILMHKRIKHIYLDNNKLNINIKIIKDILSISVPTTLIRLISMIGLFLEPIILTNVLIKTGFNIKYITIEYGIINSYIIPLLSIPSFFSIAISSALLPNITKLYARKKYDLFNKKIYRLTLIIILIGSINLSIILMFPKEILMLIYNVNFGINYVYKLAGVFIFLYIQPILSIVLQASGNTNKLFITNSISVIIKYSLLYILGINGFGINSFIICIISGILISTILGFVIVIKIIKKA